MRALAHFVPTAFLISALTTFAPLRADETADPEVRKSVVKIFATTRHPDVFRPWTGGDPRWYRLGRRDRGQAHPDQ